jgi:cytoskeletal protein CcmA (bactofilin family)|tara:strand:+ start:754 stop:1200 length:447 start_codon:yes stop_codon:yes gene_type:complete
MFGEKNMFGDNKDKLVSLVVEKSSIGADFTIEGLVNSAGEVDLGGSIKGPVNVKALIIKEKGSVIGEINAEVVNVLGFVDGKVTAKKITVGATGEVKGDLEFTESLVVEEGARLDGNVKKVPLAKIENKVSNFMNTTKEVRKTFLKKD